MKTNDPLEDDLHENILYIQGLELPTIKGYNHTYAFNRMNEYDLTTQAILINDINSYEAIKKIPPKVIMAHTYPPELGLNDVIIPGQWQHWIIRSTVELIKVINPAVPIDILIPGGFIGIPNQHGNISTKYKDVYRLAFAKANLLNQVNLISESSFRKTTNNIKLSTDTAGEIKFLLDYCNKTGISSDEALQIGRLPHIRVSYLAHRLGAQKTISAESILIVNHPNSIIRFIERYEPELLLDLKIFKKTEERNFALMKLLHDPDGKLLNLLSQVLSAISPIIKNNSSAH